MMMMITMTYYEFNRNRFILITSILFVVSISIHFVTAYYSYIDVATEHKAKKIIFTSFLIEYTRQVFENIQSEMIQTIWQTLGLTLLFFTTVIDNKKKKE